MLTATWEKKGLRYIPNAVCCEEHYQWHFTNCEHANSEDIVVDKKKVQNGECGNTISEYLF